MSLVTTLFGWPKSRGKGGEGFLELLRGAGKRVLSQQAGHKEGKGSGLQGAQFSWQCTAATPSTPHRAEEITDRDLVAETERDAVHQLSEGNCDDK